MQPLLVIALALGLAGSPLLRAAEVVAESRDHSVGGVFGGLSGVLIGGAAGGPLGALAGAALGAWSGSQLQRLSGQSGTAYLVQSDSGERRRLRAPQGGLRPGQRVSLRDGRLYPSH